MAVKLTDCGLFYKCTVWKLNGLVYWGVVEMCNNMFAYNSAIKLNYGHYKGQDTDVTYSINIIYL